MTYERFDAAFAMLFLLVCLAFVDVVLAVFEHAVDDAGQFVGEDGDGFAGAVMGFHAAEIGSQIAFAVPEGLRGDAQGVGDSVVDSFGSPAYDFSAGNDVIRTDAA